MRTHCANYGKMITKSHEIRAQPPSKAVTRKEMRERAVIHVSRLIVTLRTGIPIASVSLLPPTAWAQPTHHGVLL